MIAIHSGIGSINFNVSAGRYCSLTNAPYEVARVGSVSVVGIGQTWLEYQPPHTQSEYKQ